jgi:DNA-binding MarR family transcriptional regulator
MPSRSDEERKQHLAHMRSTMKNLFGVEDTSGVELFSMLRHMAHMCEPPDDKDLSGPRWRIMLHLLGQEHTGNSAGPTPTDLSHNQRVSKNTISALLRGLEEQGLIQRTLDPTDYRVFRIQLTQAGRELIHATAPLRLAHMNRMASGLTREERVQLMALLEKLHQSMKDSSCKTAPNPETESSESDGG